MRRVEVGEDKVVLRDEGTGRFAILSFRGWAKLRSLAAGIDTAIDGIVNKLPDVFYRRHLGAGWFVTVQSNVWCVDIRKYYKPNVEDPDDDDAPRPTRVGIGLRLREWRMLKDATEAMDVYRPDIARVQPCFHQNQEGE